MVRGLIVKKLSSLFLIYDEIDFRQIGYWLGGNDYVIEGQWRWSETGTGLGDFTQWGPGYPDGNRTHDCMLQVFNGETSMWIDSNCAHAHYYICEHQ